MVCGRVYRTEEDPVCGMEVEIEDPPAEAKHKGKTYYFCNSRCKEKFQENPEEYTE